MFVRAIWALTLAGLAFTTLFLTFRHLHFKLADGELASGLTHVVLSTAESELRPLAVAIHSTWVHAAEPEKIQFHIITSPQLQQIIAEQLQAYLPEVRVQVHANERALKKISELVTYRSSSQVPRKASNIFNFVRFFLPEFLGRSLLGRASRLVYVDSEAVVLGDVNVLAKIDLEGTAVAAARSCRFELSEILDFDLLAAEMFQLPKVRPQDCALSPELMVIDLGRWQLENISGKIQTWLQRYRDQPLDEDLWVKSLIMPPWMLSLDRFVELDAAWGCANLGSEELSAQETNTLLKKGLAREDLAGLELGISPSGRLQPPLNLCTAQSKLLHFSGPAKPWLNSRPNPLCALPQVPAPRHGWAPAGEPEILLRCTIAGQELHVVNCSSLWWAFLTSEQDCGLKGYDAGWPDVDKD